MANKKIQRASLKKASQHQALLACPTIEKPIEEEKVEATSGEQVSSLLEPEAQVPAAPVLERARLQLGQWLNQLYSFLLYKIFLPILGAALVLFACQLVLQSQLSPSEPVTTNLGPNQQQLNSQSPKHKPLVQPDLLMTYLEFANRYPRKRSTLPQPVERSHRNLLFTNDLFQVSSHNLAYLAGIHSYQLRQSPFSADRTLEERSDMLGQLDEFDLAQIKSNLRRATRGAR